MRAIDTNVVLRVVLNDDPVQSPIAMRLLDQPALVGIAVLMETEWVLRSTYRRSREVIATALSAFLEIPTVTVTDLRGVRWAIERYRAHGADLADMLHIVAAKGSPSFASFEKRLSAEAGPETPVAIERPA